MDTQAPTLDQLADDFAERFAERLGCIDAYTGAMYGSPFSKLQDSQKTYTLEVVAHAVEHSMNVSDPDQKKVAFAGLRKALSILEDPQVHGASKPLVAALLGRFADAVAYYDLVSADAY